MRRVTVAQRSASRLLSVTEFNRVSRHRTLVSYLTVSWLLTVGMFTANFTLVTLMSLRSLLTLNPVNSVNSYQRGLDCLGAPCVCCVVTASQSKVYLQSYEAGAAALKGWTETHSELINVLDELLTKHHLCQNSPADAHNFSFYYYYFIFFNFLLTAVWGSAGVIDMELDGVALSSCRICNAITFLCLQSKLSCQPV